MNQEVDGACMVLSPRQPPPPFIPLHSPYPPPQSPTAASCPALPCLPTTHPSPVSHCDGRKDGWFGRVHGSLPCLRGRNIDQHVQHCAAGSQRQRRQCAVDGGVRNAIITGVLKIAVPYPNGPSRGLTLHGTFIFHNVTVLEFRL